MNLLTVISHGVIQSLGRNINAYFPIVTSNSYIFDLFLDDKLEQNKIFEQVRGKLDAQIQSLRQMTSALEDRLEQSQQDASTLRRHQATYEGKIHSLMEENNLLKQRLAQRSAEVHNAANDVQVFHR